MGSTFLFTVIVIVGLLSTGHGLPADDKATDNRAGLERPSTEASPEVSECGLNALLGELYGSSENSGCGSSSQPAVPPNNNVDPIPPPVNNGGSNPPPDDNPSLKPSDPENPQPPSTDSQEKDCTCVQYYLCTENNTINEDGQGVIDIRINPCGNYLLTCCGDKNIRPPDNPVTPKPKPSSDTRPKCGKRNIEGLGFRITGDKDNEAQYGEFPWMVAVVQPSQTAASNGKTVNVYQCGGSLIHPQVVLTGAHCVEGKNNLVIRAGEWDTQTKNEFYPTQDRNVREVIIHEGFNSKSLINDPALLILNSPINMTQENVGLVCLPEASENMEGRDCVASGWGKDVFGKDGKYQVIMKKVELPTVRRAPCLEALRKTRLGSNFKLHESFICAGGKPGKDTCKGDGGGPLACPSRSNPEMYVQAGIVAWGIDCGTTTPGVYVNVPFFVNWIINNLEAKGFSMDSY